MTGRSLGSRAIRYVRRSLKRQFGPSVASVQFTSDADFLRLFEIEAQGVTFSPSAPDAKLILLNHFGQRIDNNWPAVPDALTDMRIDLSRMTDEEVIERANLALAGDLHPSGIQPELNAGGSINWTANPANSREWLLMLHRHSWWPLWGAAYRLCGDEKYAEAFVSQLTEWIDQHPMPRQKSEHTEAWRLMEAGLRLRVSWLPSFACFFSAPAFTDDAKITMLRAVYDHAQFLSLFYTNRNHLVRESNGLLAAGLCFPEFVDSARWTEQALQRLDQELRAQLNSDGSQIEMSVGYQWLTIDEFEVTRAVLNEYQRELPTSDLDNELHKMYEYLAAVIRPDQSFPQLNDGFILWDAKRLERAGRSNSWGDIEFAASGGSSGTEPEYCSRSFPNAGIHVMRSDWTADARYLIADTGPYGGPHGHEDKLSFELFAYGAQFIVDPGSYTYDRGDAFRNYFVGSQGHNTVLVDQKSQVRRWNAQHMTPRSADVSHGHWQADTDIDCLSGQYNEGYAPFSLAWPDKLNVDFDVAHQRDFLFARPDYWVIVDNLNARNLHDYSFLFHLAPEMRVINRSEKSALLESATNGAQLIVQAITTQDFGSEVIEGQEAPIQGWYSTDHHKKCAAPTLVFEAGQTDRALVAWVFYPLPSDVDAEQVRVSCPVAPTEFRIAIEISRDGANDTVSIVKDPEARSTDADHSPSVITVDRVGKKRWSSNRRVSSH